MIDRVAEALMDTLGGPYKWDDAPEDIKELWKIHAKVAIEAMREPTDDMIRSGVDALHGSGELRYVYKAMLRQALKDT